MAYKRLPNLEIEDAHIIFRNFSGKETEFNRAGRRTFCVVIDDEKQAEQLEKDGWNVSPLRKRDENDDQSYKLPVEVRFDNYPPTIILIAGNTKTQLDEDDVSRLDSADILNVDLVINPSHWEVNGKSGVKAYVKEMYVTIEQSSFARKYAEMEYPEELPFA